jgi:zinc-binding alcohol dehydrogenase/oxidoreductase
MYALVLDGVGEKLRIEQRPDLKPGAQGVVVALEAAALNRRDFWITQGRYPGMVFPAILGSDGAGVVRTVGTDVDPKWVGKKVLINPSLDWGDKQSAQGPSFRILGMPDHGTFATEVHVKGAQLAEKPKHLSMEQAAALPLAGLTAYRALFSQGGLQSGEKVLVTGAGGGVASLAIQFATAAGARVFCTSSSESKREKGKQLGAINAYDYRLPNWEETLRGDHGGMDLIIDGSGGDKFMSLLETLEAGGRLVNYGVTAGSPKGIDLFKIFWRQLRIIGSTMGSPRDFAEMIALVERHAIVPAVDRVFSLAEGNEALAHMASFGNFGKVVLATKM